MIIGVTGKFGSGKSHLANFLSDKTGYPIFHFDKYIIEKLMRPCIRQIVEKRIGCKLSLEHSHLLSNLQTLERTLTKFEKGMILGMGNRKIKKLMRSGSPVIIDFFGLPISKHFKNFKLKILIQSDDQTRVKKLAERNGFTPEQVAHIDKIANDIVDYKDHEYDHIIINDYKSIPKAIQEITCELTNT